MKKAKIILTIAISLVALNKVSAQSLTLHPEQFSVEDTNDQIWMEFYEWSAWEQQSVKNIVNLPANYIKAAIDNNLQLVDANIPSDDVFYSQLGESYETDAAIDNFSQREDIELDGFVGSHSGVVVYSKVLVDLKSDINIGALNTDKFVQKINAADRPHMHQVISKDFARNLIEPLSYGQQIISEMKESDKLVFTTINTGEDYYQCGFLNSALAFKGELEGISSYDESFRMYNISRVKELSSLEVTVLKDLIPSGAVKVFEQKTAYSSSLIKSSVMYFAFYQTDSGPKLVSSTVLIITDKVKAVIANLVNGVGLAKAVNPFDGLKFNREGILRVDDRKLGTSELSGSCSKGVAKGMGRYVYDLAKGIAAQ